MLQKHMEITSLRIGQPEKNMSLIAFSESSLCDATYQNLQHLTWVKTRDHVSYQQKTIISMGNLMSRAYKNYQHKGATQSLSIWMKYFQYLHHSQIVKGKHPFCGKPSCPHFRF